MSILFGDIIDDDQGFFGSIFDLVLTSPFEIAGATAEAASDTVIGDSIRTLGVLVLLALVAIVAVIGLDAVATAQDVFT